MLFSATQTRKTEDLARVSLKKEPLYVGVDDTKDKATVAGLEQVRDLWFIDEDMVLEQSGAISTQLVIC